MFNLISIMDVSPKYLRDSDRLIIMTRYPEAGRAKTRLIPALGAEGAAGLQRLMTEHTVAQAQRLGVRTEICFTGGTGAQMRRWLGEKPAFSRQGGGDLGERMARALGRHFRGGGRKAVVIGCDCPDNRTTDIHECFQALDSNECAIGPASDGGYYMIGLRRPAPQLFRGIDWGSGKVLRQTLERASMLGLSMHLLAERRDVDRPEDIPERISVVIPTLNEEGSIKDALTGAQSAFNVECVVVDGGSADATIRIAAECGARVLREKRRRAGQMNAGAGVAGGDIFLFLHADTQLPADWDRLVRPALEDPGVALGAFRFRVRERLGGIGTIEWLTHLRSHYLGRPYGDQALFLRAETFRSLGGFPDMPIMEDVELVRKARRSGRVITLKEPALSSGRRWQRLGVFRGSLTNQLVLLGHAFGVPAHRLARFYRL